jgi:eukaryotic-like serine/threonine-protein kinase
VTGYRAETRAAETRAVAYRQMTCYLSLHTRVGLEVACGRPGELGMNGRPSRNIRFGPFELDVRSAELRKGGTRVRLADQPFQILLMLLERPGDLISREEIRSKLWPGTTVVEFDHSINAAVKRLRNALRDSAGEPRYIETLPRRGYRFIGQVEAPMSEAGGPQKSTRPTAPYVEGAAASGFALQRSRGRLWMAAAGVLAIVATGAWWWYARQAPARWARNVALPQGIRLADEGDGARAFPYLYGALQILPHDPASNRKLREISHLFAIRTTPPGADVYVKPYTTPDAPWVSIGRSPVENFLLPLGCFRWRIVRPGYRTLEAAGGFQSNSIEFTLDPDRSFPRDMVHVPGGDFQWSTLKPMHLDDFWIDSYEVTNRQFKEFADNGYANRQYWREEFIENGRVFSWEQAMAKFRDATGRPGPATWEVGTYPQGQDDFPVSGVSWYEAAAYAEFAGKQLPSIYHWYRAASPGIYSEVLLFSNFESSGPVRVGSRGGLGPFGTYDMAGNVREWCFNANGARRYSLGGAWDEGRSYYLTPGALPPFDRSAANGFRCVKYTAGSTLQAVRAAIDKPARDYKSERPVTDEVFHALQSSYSYDHTDLKPVVESVDQTAVWKAEKITFDAAYDHQRVPAWLYMPRTAKPPYQTIMFVPPRSSLYLAKIDEYEVKFIEFLLKSGRAVLFTICQGMYERRQADLVGSSRERDRVVQQCKDLRRSLDYLDTRSDIAHSRIGYYGVSDGARLGVILAPQEPRIRAAVLAAGGLPSAPKPPEIDELNFAPRVRIPVLMLNGRYDLSYLAETSQTTLFHLLGAPDSQKRHILFDIGHVPLQRLEMRETMDWFDRYLGQVSR